ncbi:MAG TPA: NAD(P)-dependent oxidoreductase [Candidatus Limnocylindrales bacterium]|nr:NAD(P)-dependent oxidoreductase [Candidatus Limnocylindrales bacterium]
MPSASSEPIVVCLPEYPGVEHIGELPDNVDVVWVAEEADPSTLPNVGDIDLVVPLQVMRKPILAALDQASTGRLKVIQTLSAGVDWLAGHVPAHITVCNAKGAFDAPLAEWVVGAILAMERGLIQSRDLEITRDWTPFEPTEVAGRRVVILGHGSIGAAIAARLKAFDADVVGVARTPRPDEGVLGLDSLDELLPTAHVLVNMLPLSTETTGLLDERRLALLPDEALVVNGGRGRTIDAVALLRELDLGRLRAVLDVTDPEPLPPESPLWSIPNVLISPHIAGDSAPATVRTFEIAGDQIRRFAAGEPLQNQVPRYLLE